MTDSRQILFGFVWYAVFVFSTCLHEASHALLAWRLGDATAYRGGQVTLNPMPHIRREPIGMVVLPFLSYFMGGWMIGWASAPYNMLWAQRYPRRAALMALAGPLANLALLVTAGVLIRAGLHLGFFTPGDISFTSITVGTSPTAQGVAAILSLFFTLNLLLFIFNLVPLPPLDGSGALPLFMSDQAARRFQGFVHQPVVMIVTLLLLWHFFGYIFAPIFFKAIDILYLGLASYG